MPRLTLRTLLAYIDDTLEPTEARSLGKKVAESEEARQLVERIKRVTRRRGLSTPVITDQDDAADPNTVAAYLDNALDSSTLKQVEETCLESDVHLAEVAACHQILTLVLTEPVRVPPRAHRRMYQLVPPPASVPNRRPSKTLPISGAAPPGEAAPEADDADAALLLGMKRYTAATTWAARFALFGAAAVLLVLLTGAVLLSLPHQSPKAPESSAGHSYVLLAPQVALPPVAGGAAEPPKKEPPSGAPAGPPKVDSAPAGGFAALATSATTDATTKKPVAPPPAGMGMLDVVVAPPPDKRERIGRLETQGVLVLYQKLNDPAPLPWSRVKAKDEDDPLFSNDPIMALPGYKANVLLGERGKQVEVHLWGNVPEQLQYRVLESRVKFHVPPDGFDADITLLGGRIYLKSKKFDAEKNPTSAKVRLRVADEVWDVTLTDAKTDVLVELITWFEPGTPYARKDGPRAKQEGRVAVVFGAAGFQAPKRFKTIDRVGEGNQLTWDSSSGTLSNPRPIDSPQDSQRVPLLEGEFQAILGKVLSATAEAVTDVNGARSVVKGRLEPGPNVANRDLVARLAVYAQAAMTDSTAESEDLLKELVDVLRSELLWEARQATVTALVNWVARDRAHTAILHRVLVARRVGDDREPEVVADWLLQLLRGYITPFVSVTRPETVLLAQLVEKRDANTGALLEDKEIAVREAALWNLEAVRQAKWVPRPDRVNVGAVGAKVNTPEYKGFVEMWRKRAEGFKTRELKKP